MLRENITFCVAGDKFIFLDLTEGRYFTLSRRDTNHFRELCEGGDEPARQEDLSPGLSRLLLRSPGGAMLPCRLTTPPRSSLLDEPGLSSPLVHQAAAFWQLRSAMWALKRRPLAAHVENLRRQKAGLSSALHDFQGALALEDIRSMALGHDQCLPRSLALVRWAAARGLALDLIFGVTARPFQAHCWVQHGDMVLNDHLDHVAGFTPILSV